MRKTIYAMALALATICQLAAFPCTGFGQEEAGQLGSEAHGVAGDNQQSVESGWIPRSTEWESNTIKTGEFTFADEHDPIKGREDDPERERVRQTYREAYRGWIVKPNQPRNVYGRLLSTEGDQAFQETEATLDDCECGGEACKCPPYVCKKGDCKKNFVAMFSVTTCGPCRRMYPVMKQLREDGYIVYMYTLDVAEFRDEDLDAKYNIDVFPTFVIFEDGKEVVRTVGVNDAEWFRTNLKTREQQEAQPEIKPNPYDGI